MEGCLQHLRIGEDCAGVNDNVNDRRTSAGLENASTIDHSAFAGQDRIFSRRDHRGVGVMTLTSNPSIFSRLYLRFRISMERSSTQIPQPTYKPTSKSTHINNVSEKRYLPASICPGRR